MNAPAGFTRLDNNCLHHVHLPPTDAYPEGHKLVPGANNVPTEYVTALKSFKVPYRGSDGKRGTRNLFDDLGYPSKASGGKAQVVVLGSVAEDAPEGPPAPFDLAEYKEELALKLVEVTTDKEALKRWSKDQRTAVATAAKLKSR
jgi:hypothetical protein